MSGPHFKEIVNTVCMTTGLSKKRVAHLLNVDPVTVNMWEREGIPVFRKPYVISVLRQALLKHMHGGLEYASK